MDDSNSERKNQLLRRLNDLRMIAAPQWARVTSREPDEKSKRRLARVKKIDRIKKRLQSLPIEDIPAALNARIDAIQKEIDATEKKDAAAADRAFRRSMAEFIRYERDQKARKATQVLVPSQQQAPSKSLKATRTKPPNTYPNRAAQLKARLDERKWTPRKLEEKGGPEHRSTQKVLDGKEVQERVLESIASGLSEHKKFPTVKREDIRND